MILRTEQGTEYRAIIAETGSSQVELLLTDVSPLASMIKEIENSGYLELFDSESDSWQKIVGPFYIITVVRQSEGSYFITAERRG